MEFSTKFEGREERIVRLFADTFAASEGADEGAVIGDLVRDLLGHAPAGDIRVFTAEETGDLRAGAVFSRLIYEDPRTVFILSPMAVGTGHQGQGLGQRLLTHALASLAASGVDVAVTYGDPAFYSKIGFQQVSEAVVPAPLPLSQPHGWMAQALGATGLGPLRGPCTCVPALNKPAIW
jgi:predicted N-acetyltransferase YhbS